VKIDFPSRYSRKTLGPVKTFRPVSVRMFRIHAIDMSVINSAEFDERSKIMM
jgi:hypothetical protein